MNRTWKSLLVSDPLPALLAGGNPALEYFVRRDLLEEPVGPIESLWGLAEPRRLDEKQQADGSWRYPGKADHPAPNANYTLLETFRNLRVLIEMYGFQLPHPAIQKAAEYVFSCQTDEGDIRGILGNQYMPYYHAAILELLIKCGYAKDARILKGLDWLLSMRQADGGWIVPAQLVPPDQKTAQFWPSPPVQPDRTKPHSHLATGMVLPAFAAHPDYRQRPEVILAGQRLAERLFQADKYYDRKAASYWLKFQFPFWWPSLVSALNALSLLGIDRQDHNFARGLDWFVTNQYPDNLWETGYGKGRNAQELRRWVGLAICRVLDRSCRNGI